MKIAVLMSAYNGEKYIEKQINTILSQTGDYQLDLWVRDDGSQDSTPYILQKYADHHKLKWYTGENLGPAHSFLDLIKHCPPYDFYAFADQDDDWMPDKLSAAIKLLQKPQKPQLYFSNAELVDSSLASLGRNVYRTSPCLDFFTLTCAGGLLGCTMVFNFELAKLIIEKPLPGKIVLHDFYLSVLCKAMNGEIIFDEIPHMKYRQHNSNVVGMSHGLIGTLKDRFYSITAKPSVSIAQQSSEILNLYGDRLCLENRAWLKKTASYQNSMITRINLAMSHKTVYMNKNMAITLRLSILLGNR